MELKDLNFVFAEKTIREKRRKMELEALAAKNISGLITHIKLLTYRKNTHPFGVCYSVAEMLKELGYKQASDGMSRKVTMIGHDWVIKTAETVGDSPIKAVAQKEFKVLGYDFVAQPKLEINYTKYEALDLAMSDMFRRKEIKCSFTDFLGSDFHCDNVGFSEDGDFWIHDY